jgi:hypothetical protein
MSYLFHCHILARHDSLIKADILCPISCIVKVWFRHGFLYKAVN